MNEDRPGYLGGTEPFPERWHEPFRHLVHRLVLRDYEGLASDGVIVADGSEAAGFGIWIEDYPDELVDLPENPWPYSSWSATDDPQMFTATIELWTRQQDPGDLTLEATVWDDGDRLLRLRADDAHVM